MASNHVLTPQDSDDPDCTEFVLEQRSVWIRVDDPTGKGESIAVYVCRTDEGVTVDLYPEGREMDAHLGGTWATFAEATDPNEEDSE